MSPRTTWRPLAPRPVSSPSLRPRSSQPLAMFTAGLCRSGQSSISFSARSWAMASARVAGGVVVGSCANARAPARMDTTANRTAATNRLSMVRVVMSLAGATPGNIARRLAPGRFTPALTLAAVKCLDGEAVVHTDGEHVVSLLALRADALVEDACLRISEHVGDDPDRHAGDAVFLAEVRIEQRIVRVGPV